uniref:Uncharacterized protein n=1 Tax=Anguilla anguilla TaxID=7936 RepID=A0A0E9WM98_ANGAN
MAGGGLARSSQSYPTLCMRGHLPWQLSRDKTNIKKTVNVLCRPSNNIEKP